MAEYTPEQKKAIREVYAKDATDAQFEVFLKECQDRNLVPGKQVYFQLRSQSSKDDNGNWVKEKRPIHLTSIDSLRLIAQRSGQYQGQTPPTYIYLDKNNFPNLKSDIMLPNADNPDMPARPYAVQVSVFRKGFSQALTATARFEAYAQKKFNGGLTDMWDKRGPEQLAKCAEALALRQAFPEEIGGLYIAEEFSNEPEVEEVEKPKKAKSREEKKNGPDVSVDPFVHSGIEATGPVAPTAEYRRNWIKKLRVLGVEVEKLKAYVDKHYVVKSSLDLTTEQMSDIEQKCTKARETSLEQLNKLLEG